MRKSSLKILQYLLQAYHKSDIPNFILYTLALNIRTHREQRLIKALLLYHANRTMEVELSPDIWLFGSDKFVFDLNNYFEIKSIMAEINESYGFKSPFTLA